jgi:hypothetical protein
VGESLLLKIANPISSKPLEIRLRSRHLCAVCNISVVEAAEIDDDLRTGEDVKDKDSPSRIV